MANLNANEKDLSTQKRRVVSPETIVYGNKEVNLYSEIVINIITPRRSIQISVAKTGGRSAKLTR